jgi:hypothetical protein
MPQRSGRGMPIAALIGPATDIDATLAVTANGKKVEGDANSPARPAIGASGGIRQPMNDLCVTFVPTRELPARARIDVTLTVDGEIERRWWFRTAR